MGYDNRPIGIFDSGVGGLTVLAEVKKNLPHESTIYVGDTANVPYGGKSPEVLLRHGRDIIRFLQNQDVKAIVLACGTTSSTVYEDLAKEFPHIPLVDVIRPGVKACVKLKIPRLGIIATAATIKSGLFAHLIKTQAPGIHLEAQACPIFAPMIESGITRGSIAEWAIETYIGHWQGKIDALVLGCTHYPLLTGALTHVLGKSMQYVNLAEHTTQALKSLLVAKNIQSDSTCQARHKFYVSGNPEAFNKTAHILLRDSPNATKISWT